MFNISLDTDYALRIVFALAHNTEWQDKNSVAKSMHLHSYQFDAALVRLKQAGFVCEKDGMCKLKAETDSLSVYDVIRAIEGDIHINRCLEDDEFCSRDATNTCVIREMYTALQQSIIDALKNKTIAVLLEDEQRG